MLQSQPWRPRQDDPEKSEFSLVYIVSSEWARAALERLSQRKPVVVPDLFAHSYIPKASLVCTPPQRPPAQCGQLPSPCCLPALPFAPLATPISPISLCQTQAFCCPRHGVPPSGLLSLPTFGSSLMTLHPSSILCPRPLKPPQDTSTFHDYE